MTRDGEAMVKGGVPVTTIIQHKPLPGAVEIYENWLKEIIPVAQSYCGHQSVHVIRPSSPAQPYTITLHFDHIENLKNWLESDARAALVERIRPHLSEAEALDIKTGFEFWFTPPPAGKPARPYKQFLITLSAIYPLTLIVPALLKPVFASSSLFLLPGMAALCVAVVIVALMVWVIMPRYTRAVSNWLFR